MGKKDFYKEYLEQHTLEEMLRNTSPPKPEPASSPPSSLLKLPLLSPHLYGILYVDERDRYVNEKGHQHQLRYLNLERGVVYEAATSHFPIESIFASEKRLYYGVGRNDGGIVDVLNKKFDIDPLNNDGAYALGEWEGKLLVGRFGDLFDATNHQSMLYLGLELQISSIQTDSKGGLYFTSNFFIPLLMFSSYHGRLMEVVKSGEGYIAGEPLFKYSVSHLQAPSKVLLIPEGTFKRKDKKEYPFSVIDCIKGGYLRLNKEVIGSTAELGTITQLKLLHCSKDTAEILYCTKDPNQTRYAQVDLQRRITPQNNAISKLFGYPIYVLEPVTSLSLHQKLMEKIERGLMEKVEQHA